ncbi:conserved hypothetical protein [Ricinus communis]|uniref:Late embryogenesis abundant protein LEA-2 subgroup domain-containing protein n=1 Tax=Ricinus communis TaxID=3988 RepID=B9T0Q2_RICCO|nr:conserved hypothetical protein [Ricinus communis]|eukprot:XP_002531821.1 uncharacterized protein LOC8271692 [Ricinus communis]
MTETNDQLPSKRQRRRRCCFIVGGVALFLVLLLFIIILILALTVFKAKEPKVDLVSATLDGISPRISFPVINIQLNISLNLNLLVHNRNYASFKHGAGKTSLLYQDKQIGEADLYPGVIPSRGSAPLACRLTIEVDELASDMTELIQDVLAGQLVMETRTSIPGRVTFLGIIKKHAVATSACRFTIAFPAMKIQNQECRSKTKL